MVRFEKEGMVKYNCQKVKDNLYIQWLKDYMIENKCNEEDLRFQEYEKELVGFILKCSEFSYADFMESLPKDFRIRFGKAARELGFNPWLDKHK